MSIWYFCSVFIHITLAAFWIGGMLFLPLVLLPGIKGHPDRSALLYATGLRFQRYGWVALAGLLCTGLFNMYLRGLPFAWDFFMRSAYGQLVSAKLGIFTLILLLSALHDFMFGKKALNDLPQGRQSEQLRLLARWSGRLNLLLALVMAFLGLVLSRGVGWPLS